MNGSKQQWKIWLAAAGIIGLCLLVSYNSTAEVYDRGLNKFKAGNVSGACHIFRKVVEREPEHADAWYYLGFCYQQLGSTLQAIGAYQQVLNQAEHPLTLYRLAQRYAELGYNSQSAAAYNRACQIDPLAIAIYNQVAARIGQADTFVAENGTCYGEISKNTGRPRTVYVHGYYRKDGTYVRSHYRSPPRR